MQPNLHAPSSFFYLPIPVVSEPVVIAWDICCAPLSLLTVRCWAVFRYRLTERVYFGSDMHKLPPHELNRTAFPSSAT